MEYMRERILPSGAMLLKAEEVCHHLYFVESGLLRCFYYQGGKEISSRFVQQGEICWSAQSFLLRQTGTEYIQALERSNLVSLSFQALHLLSQQFPSFDRVRQQITETYLIEIEQRMRAMWMQRSGEKLDWFERRFPGLLEKVQNRHIASYLGITEVMLSRLRHRG